LFAGSSGTGKTMAAEVLANTLRLDLCRIDLSIVFSKYIGETEKNLKRVFSETASTSALLLFDEADALLGAGSNANDAHDRYANAETAHFLQRIESHNGIVILTTNGKQRIDQAFSPRTQVVVMVGTMGTGRMKKK